MSALLERFADGLLGLRLMHWALLVVGLALVSLMVYFQRKSGNAYNALDTLLDQSTGKASLDKHIVLLFAFLAAWVVIVRTVADKDVDTLLLGVLGVFIVNRAASKFFDKDKPPGEGGS